ncbi:MAG: UTP--glucose-1-phosphate uridylyltransferase GalU [Candidatus Kinetoplastibacterium crithidii]|nr:UTP--glucose-1-phosphate uridylyltransferase GalU [Candidatus Kinetoplastibacterium crithidii]
MSNIRKAIFPLGGGMGTRLLPITKALPKEIIPIIDKPLIQYAVEEAISAGITELIFITSRNKRIIEDHFDSSPELEKYLIDNNKTEMLSIINNIVPKNIKFSFIRQSKPLGLGHAILSAEHIINKEEFAVILADDLIDSKTPVIKQLILIFQQTNSNVIAIQDVSLEEIEKYGIVATQKYHQIKNTEEITSIVEKPTQTNAPSQTAIIGRYIFKPDIFDHLRTITPDIKGEIQLTEAMISLLKEKKILAYRYEGERFDCGTKHGLFYANIYFGEKYHGFNTIRS